MTKTRTCRAPRMTPPPWRRQTTTQTWRLWTRTTAASAATASMARMRRPKTSLRSSFTTTRASNHTCGSGAWAHLRLCFYALHLHRMCDIQCFEFARNAQSERFESQGSLATDRPAMRELYIVLLSAALSLCFDGRELICRLTPVFKNGVCCCCSKCRVVLLVPAVDDQAAPTFAQVDKLVCRRAGRRRKRRRPCRASPPSSTSSASTRTRSAAAARTRSADGASPRRYATKRIRTHVASDIPSAAQRTSGSSPPPT